MKEIKYTYWIYYIDPRLIDDLTCIINESNYIYAYTDNKEYSEIFENIHDMSKFIKKKLQLTKTEVNILAQEEMLQYLKRRSLITKDSEGNSMQVDMVLTMQEERYLELQTISSINNLIYKVCVNPFPIRIFDNRVIEDLNKIYFDELMNNSIHGKSSPLIGTNFIEILFKGVKHKIIADEVSIYIHLFHNILKEI